MYHKQRVILADAIAVVRPDWQQAGILSQLHTLDASWAGTDAALAAHAMAVASNRAAQTPGAFNVTPPQGTPQHVPDDPLEREPRCHTCGNPRPACHRQQDFEISHGLEPHSFETEQDANANTAPRSVEQRQQLRQQIRTLIRRVNDEVKA
jgi:hypothetical protein